MTLNIVLLIIAALISLPGGLFVATVISQPQIRKFGLMGGVVGLIVTAIGLEYFVQAGGVTIDAMSWFLGAFLACTMGVAIGALVVDFITSAGRDRDLHITEP